MPTVNIYQPASFSADIKPLISELKELIARELTCGDLAITDKEVSVRIITVGGEMIGELEIDIHAHEFEARVVRQDEICKVVRSFVMDKLPSVRDVRVWLVLSQLGHSW